MNYSQIKFSIENNIAHIIFNTEGTLNALTVEMSEEVSHALDEAVKSARVVIISGQGRAFCSGANLSGGNPELHKKDNDTGARLESHFNPLILKMQNLDIPIITMVRGAAAGIGASIAMMGDIIVASENAYFLQAFINIGLVPDGGAPYLLARSIGRVRAMELMLLGEKFPAQKAFEYGMITRLVSDEALEGETKKIAHKLSNGPIVAMSLLRKSAWAALQNDLPTQLHLERNQQREAGKCNDFKEGVAAFLEKRKANFTGEKIVPINH